MLKKNWLPSPLELPSAVLSFFFFFSSKGGNEEDKQEEHTNICSCTLYSSIYTFLSL
jgi:hypothetical protein